MPVATQEVRDKVGALAKLDDVLLTAVVGATSTEIKSLIRDGAKSKVPKRAVGSHAVSELAEGFCRQRQSIDAAVNWLVFRYSSLADPAGYHLVGGFNLQTIIAHYDTEVYLIASTDLPARSHLDQLDSIVLRLWSPSAPKELQLRKSSPNLDWPARGSPSLWIGPQRLLLATVGCEKCYNVKFGNNVKEARLKNDIYKLEAQTVHTTKAINAGEKLRLHPCGTYDSMCPCGKVEGVEGESSDSDSDDEAGEEPLPATARAPVSAKAKPAPAESTRPARAAHTAANRPAPVLDTSSEEDEEEEAIEWDPSGNQEEEEEEEEEEAVRRTDEEEVASMCAPPHDNGHEEHGNRPDESTAPVTIKLGRHTLGKRRADWPTADPAVEISRKRPRSSNTFMELFDVMRTGYRNLMLNLDDLEDADERAYQEYKATVISWFRRQADHLENEDFGEPEPSAPKQKEMPEAESECRDWVKRKTKARQSFASMERKLEEQDRANEAIYSRKSKSSSRTRLDDDEESDGQSRLSD